MGSLRSPATVLVATTLATLSFAPSALTAQDCDGRTGVVGDVTGDGSANVLDAQQIARFAAGLSVPDPDRVQAFGDVNGDGTVNVLDAQLVARHAAGLPTDAPVGERCTVEIDGATTVEDTTFRGNVAIRDGGTLTVDGTDVEVTGTLTIEEGGTLEGTDSDRLNLVVGGDLDHQGTVRSNGVVVMVASEEMVPTDQELASVDSTFAGVTDPQSDPETESQWTLQGRTVADADGGTASDEAAARAQDTGDRGADGSLEKSIYVVASLGSAKLGGDGSTVVTRSSADGGDGGDVAGCGDTGGPGGDGGTLVYKFAELTVGNLTLDVGSGGEGGASDATGCPDGATNTGGEGGSPGTALLWGINRIRIEGTVRIQGMNGGEGGDATITGRDDDPGASVEARGGEGADVKVILDLPANRFGPGGSWVWDDCCEGGEGGDAMAVGGAGTQPGECRPPGGMHDEASDGGDGTAVGADGGDVTARTFTDNVNVSAMGAGTLESGGGGDADAKGGDGKTSGKLCKVGMLAPHGGDAGDADARAGSPGQHNLPLGGVGEGGDVTREMGADGGDGGDIDGPPLRSDGVPGDGGDAGCAKGGDGTDGSEGKHGTGGQENQAEDGATCAEQRSS